MRLLITLIVLVNALSGYCALSGKEILRNIHSNYEGLSSLELALDYKLYRGYQSNDVLESYSSVYKRVENRSYRRIGNTEFVTVGDVSLNINHENRNMFVSKAIAEKPLDMDVNETLKWCRDVKVKEQKEGINLRLVLAEGTDIPYAAIEVKMDKKCWIEQVVFFYAVQVDFSGTYFDKDLDYPRLEVTYQKVKKRYKDKENLLSMERFIVPVNDSYVVTELYKDYQVFDLRKKG